MFGQRCYYRDISWAAEGSKLTEGCSRACGVLIIIFLESTARPIVHVSVIIGVHYLLIILQLESVKY